MISFKASLINKPNILKRNSNGKYSETPCSFIKIDANNSNDIRALNNVSKYWEFSSFAENIAYTAKLMSSGRNIKSKYNIYALTTQNENLNKLDDEKILGLVEIEELPNNNVFLGYIQVKPELIYDLPLEIKRCGSAMLDCLKLIYSNKTISLNSRVHDFFFKNGFKLIDVEKNRFAWNKNLSSIIK